MLKINSVTCREVCSSKRERSAYSRVIHKEHPSYYINSSGLIYPKMFFMGDNGLLYPIYRLSYAISPYDLKQYSDFGVVYGKA